MSTSGEERLPSNAGIGFRRRRAPEVADDAEVVGIAPVLFEAGSDFRNRRREITRRIAPRDPATPEPSEAPEHRRVHGPTHPDRHTTWLRGLRHLVDAVEPERVAVERRALLGGRRARGVRRAARTTVEVETGRAVLSRCQPTPTPRSRRPPESTSSVDAVFASTTGRRSGEQDVRAEAELGGDAGDERECGERFEPEPVGARGLRLRAAEFARACLEVLTEHHMVGHDRLVDAGDICGPGGRPDEPTTRIIDGERGEIERLQRHGISLLASAACRGTPGAAMLALLRSCR
jgi:hypothetical protein